MKLPADDPERLALHRELRELSRTVPASEDAILTRAREIIWLYRELRYALEYGSEHAAAALSVRLTELGEPLPEEWRVRRKES